MPTATAEAPAKTHNCPECDKTLIYDAERIKDYSGDGDWLECNKCEKETKKVISCGDCDYDLCMKCTKSM